jgi:hypothetical protein
MKEVGFHPEDLAKDILKWHTGSGLFYVEEGLSIEEFA